MEFNVVILASAEQDLKDLRQYLVKNFSQPVWQESYGKIKTAIRNLKQFPLVGSIPDEFHQLNINQYRQVIVGLNRIIYEVRQQTVYVHIIVDSRRDLQTLLIRRILQGD